MSKPLFIILLLSAQLSFGQTVSEDIRLNQLGFLPQSEKIAVINTSLTSFQIVKDSNLGIVYSGTLSSSKYWNNSEEEMKIADFSDFKGTGTYRIRLSTGQLSYPFTISNDAFLSMVKGSIKAYYYNRASMALTGEFAGVYQRPLGHPDDQVVVLPSAASTGRPAGTIISTPKGWYDAGDYNKYIVNSGISTFTLLAAYENYPELYDTLDLNIPESENEIPDILDEALWNIEWMSTMQDPEDGGVYNKTTTANFQGVIMPHQATATRYVVAKGTAAALDFAAVMAMAARVYEPYLPDFASECLQKAEYAWEWAKANSNVPYNNPGASGEYPGVSTGGYGDSNFSDEFFWAAAELYISTQNDEYYDTLNLTRSFSVPGWPNVETLGILSLTTHRKNLTSVADTSTIKSKLTGITNGIKNYQKNNSPYKIPNNDFYWGSNSIPGNQGMLLMYAYELTGDIDYFNAALGALDYLLGRNATSYCFVTGFGSKSPQDIHHRQSGADNIAEPVPGFLAGGPNPYNTDDCGAGVYPTDVPAKCYVDDFCSYSTNEITINWNAPLVYISGAIHFVYKTEFLAPDTFEVHEVLKVANHQDIEIFPNPTTDKLSVKTSLTVSGLKISSVDGKQLLSAKKSEMDVSSLSKGIYILQVITPQQTIQKRIIIN